jgi:hypothetical protein
VKRSSIVGVFVCAAAMFAAALGDAVVEGISNANVLWHGNYTDRSSLDVLPVLLLAVAALICAQGLSLAAQARQTGLSTRSLILSTSRALMPREIMPLVPAIFGLQICVLFGMETTEQIVVYGHAFGGVLWLGGPVAMSLLIHAFFGVAAAFLISNALRVLGAMLTRIVKCIFAGFVRRARATIVLSVERVFCALLLIVTASLVERGPPPSVVALS